VTGSAANRGIFPSRLRSRFLVCLLRSAMISPNDASSASFQPIIEADDVYRTFEIGTSKIEVLKGVSLTIQRGEKVFLFGASGAGKTSLLYTLAGLEKPTKGRVLIDGSSLYQQSRREQARVRNRRMGYVFQNYSLLPELTALENVLVPAMIGGNPDQKRAEHLWDWAVGPATCRRNFRVENSSASPSRGR
jgi:predicted ABC-type transport system involved in lysophospholipase L1 biosynthesis ATPase subunit